MGGNRAGPKRLVRLNEFQISVDNLQYIVETMGPIDTSKHFSTKKEGTEVVKDTSFYTSFAGLAKGVLEKTLKRKFQESGLKGVYTNSLKELIESCNGLLGKDKK